MALVKFNRILAEQLQNLPILDGRVIYVIDTGEQYIDVNTERIKITGKAPNLRSTYTEIRGKGSTNPLGTVFLFQASPIVLDKPWRIKYKILSSFSSDTNFQLADIDVGGVEHKVSLFNSNNILNNENLSANSNVVAISNSEHLIGINIKDYFSSPHNFQVDIEELDNCSINFFNGGKFLNSFDGYEIKENDFVNSGIVINKVKLGASLTIGPHVFDGTKDIVIPIYDGSY